MTAKPAVTDDRAGAFLAAHYGRPVEELERLTGGFWSCAFAYRMDTERFVIRFGRERSWFEADRAAHACRSEELPVPRVLAIGDAFDGLVFAVSERVDGIFLEDAPAGSAAPLGDLVRRLLAALRQAPQDREVDYTWRSWLLGGIDPEGRNAPWRGAVAADALAGPIASRTEAKVRALLDACPERRELVHGDLVHKNVLVAPDLSRVTGVFSWKCSARGDALFDAAWLAFWAPWYPAFAAVDVWSIADDGSPDADTRFACYQLHIGLTHLWWHAQIGDAVGLHRVAARLVDLLEA